MAELHTDFTFDGDWHKWAVPNNVSIVKVEMTGGGSGSSEGGRVFAKLRVKESDTLHFLLGRSGFAASGANGGAGSAGGGGPGGNGGGGGNPGGDGGGGASQIRLNSQGGKLLAVAGGAGGKDGDGTAGNGGNGGNQSGQKGARDGGAGNVATGGTQTKGGDGGTAPNPNANGESAPNTVLARAGAGGSFDHANCLGGGGGGGGYRAGGGGQAGRNGVYVGGGGGGGSSFVGELYAIDHNDRAGGTGHGSLTLRWQDGGDFPPSAPTDVKIDGVAEVDEMPIHAYGCVVSGVPDDPSANQDVRIVLYLSNDPAGLEFLDDPWVVFKSGPPYQTYVGTWDEAELRDKITLAGLAKDTLYHGRLYSQDKRGQRSNSYVGLKFWTNRRPNPPFALLPADNTDFDSGDTISFSWDSDDPDEESGFPETPTHYRFQWRRAATVVEPAGPWTLTTATGNPVDIDIPATTFPPGSRYEWQISVRDPLGSWSEFSAANRFYVTAVALPPRLISPSKNEARIFSDAIQFTWAFQTQITDETQTTADLRYRVVGEDDLSWTTLTGDEIEPGAAGSWTLDPETFNPAVHYEWQVRTTTSSITTSAWSQSQFFWSANTPGVAIDPIGLDQTREQGTLGSHTNRIFVYTQGGGVLLGEITPCYQKTWHRKRDAIANCLVHVNQWDRDQQAFYRTLKPWAHEIVVFRNGERVFEGPITRIDGDRSSLEIEAKDVMAYVYRRIMRQGYNDSYQINNGEQVGLNTVVWRARQIIMNALVYHDPNVLPYLSVLQHPQDAIQSRVVKDYTKTAWQEIDDLAATAGLDYTTIGRRIVLNDTHQPIGRLPEMGDGDFSEPPRVTVYGMSYATDFAATNNNGVYGLAIRRDRGVIPAFGLPIITDFTDTGYVEMIASEYGESDVAGAGTDSMTPEQIARLVATLEAQAERNIANRFPMPVVVRVPDNATLSPDINLGMRQLIPGVWIPLRSSGGVIEASQWQKLDSMTVEETDAGEKISVIMSPAPNQGVDPDAEIEIPDE
jgi:hypothetical protein